MAENELLTTLHTVQTHHDLTEAEMLRVVNGVLSNWIGGVAKYAIREERHGNSDTPGGLAADTKGLDSDHGNASTKKGK